MKIWIFSVSFLLSFQAFTMGDPFSSLYDRIKQGRHQGVESAELLADAGQMEDFLSGKTSRIGKKHASEGDRLTVLKALCQNEIVYARQGKKTPKISLDAHGDASIRNHLLALKVMKKGVRLFLKDPTLIAQSRNGQSTLFSKLLDKMYGRDIYKRFYSTSSLAALFPQGFFEEMASTAYGYGDYAHQDNLSLAMFHRYQNRLASEGELYTHDRGFLIPKNSYVFYEQDLKNPVAHTIKFHELLFKDHEKSPTLLKKVIYDPSPLTPSSSLGKILVAYGDTFHRHGKTPPEILVLMLKSLYEKTTHPLIFRVKGMDGSYYGIKKYYQSWDSIKTTDINDILETDFNRSASFETTPSQKLLNAMEGLDDMPEEGPIHDIYEYIKNILVKYGYSGSLSMQILHERKLFHLEENDEPLKEETQRQLWNAQKNYVEKVLDKRKSEGFRDFCLSLRGNDTFDVKPLWDTIENFRLLLKKEAPYTSNDSLIRLATFLRRHHYKWPNLDGDIRAEDQEFLNDLGMYRMVFEGIYGDDTSRALFEFTACVYILRCMTFELYNPHDDYKNRYDAFVQMLIEKQIAGEIFMRYAQYLKGIITIDKNDLINNAEHRLCPHVSLEYLYGSSDAVNVQNILSTDTLMPSYDPVREKIIYDETPHAADLINYYRMNPMFMGIDTFVKTTLQEQFFKQMMEKKVPLYLKGDSVREMVEVLQNPDSYEEASNFSHVRDLPVEFSTLLARIFMSQVWV